MKAKVYITYKKAVLDPQGKAVSGALLTMGFKGISDVRVGRLVELELDVSSKEEARRIIKEMCERLLANPVMEDFSIEVE
ncbi:MAG: phosphoribosylformylglycinamidine synthase subunit PurS [Deltaproteobacteria bacterium]|nr:phosphoribosylformylglycinamidine synthase subunit PurS [Deltaproteobacteria bacterium]